MKRRSRLFALAALGLRRRRSSVDVQGTAGGEAKLMSIITGSAGAIAGIKAAYIPRVTVAAGEAVKDVVASADVTLVASAT